MRYGKRVIDVESVIKLNKQGVSQKSIVKRLKLIILGTVNLLLWYGNSIELPFWQLNN